MTTPDGLRSVGADDYDYPHQFVVYDPVAGRAVKTFNGPPQKNRVGINSLNGYSLTADGRTLFLFQLDEQLTAQETPN